MPYAILRFEKRKGGPARALEKHHERKKASYASNPDIDRERENLNYHLIEPQMTYHSEIQSRIQKAGCRVRKDSIRFVDTLVTVTPEYMEAMHPKDARRYFEHALDFLTREVGERNIFTAVVHMDERNPHMHVCFVPLTEDNRLCAKEIIGNREKLVAWQDKFHDHMAAAFPALERGQSASETGRKHVPTWLYKQANRLTEDMEAIRGEVNSIGAFNAGKQKDKVLEMLFKWHPEINAFENKLKPYAHRIEGLEQQARYYAEDAGKQRERFRREHYAVLNLQEKLEEYQDFVGSIPEDLRCQLIESYQAQIAQQQGYTQQEDVRQ